MKDFWIAEWIDENEIANEWEIDHRLNSNDGVRTLLEKAQEARQAIRDRQVDYRPNQASLADSIVAGRTLDLSGSISCSAFECIRNDIDRVFKNVWHYFDSIVVEGVSPIPWVDSYKKGDEDSRRMQLHQVAEQARVLLYLRSIGADKFTLYTHKTFSFCQEHWLQHAKELGIEAAADESQRERVVREIVDNSEFTIMTVGGSSWATKITGRYINTSGFLLMYRESAPTNEEVALEMLSCYGTATISDVELARRLSLPLLEPAKLELPQSKPKPAKTKPGRGLSEQAKGYPRPTVADVALSLQLPVFDNLTTADLLKIREDERPHFEAFRSALRSAIQDKLASANQDVSAPIVARTIDEGSYSA